MTRLFLDTLGVLIGLIGIITLCAMVPFGLIVVFCFFTAGYLMSEASNG